MPGGRLKGMATARGSRMQFHWEPVWSRAPRLVLTDRPGVRAAALVTSGDHGRSVRYEPRQGPKGFCFEESGTPRRGQMTFGRKASWSDRCVSCSSNDMWKSFLPGIDLSHDGRKSVEAIAYGRARPRNSSMRRIHLRGGKMHKTDTGEIQDESTFLGTSPRRKGLAPPSAGEEADSARRARPGSPGTKRGKTGQPRNGACSRRSRQSRRQPLGSSSRCE